MGFKEAKRHLEYQADEATGIDLVNTGQFLVQCKAMKKMPNIPKVFGEFEYDDDEMMPVVVFKVDQKGKYACFKWEDAQVLMGWIHAFQTGNLPEA